MDGVTNEMKENVRRYVAQRLLEVPEMIPALATHLAQATSQMMSAEDHGATDWTSVAAHAKVDCGVYMEGVVIFVKPCSMRYHYDGTVGKLLGLELTQFPSDADTIRSVGLYVENFWSQLALSMDPGYMIRDLALPELVILPDGETIIHRDSLELVVLGQLRMVNGTMSLVDTAMAREYGVVTLSLTMRLLGHWSSLGSFVESISELLGGLRAEADEVTCPEGSPELYGALDRLRFNLEWIRPYCAKLDSAVTVVKPRPGGLLPDPEFLGGMDLPGGEPGDYPVGGEHDPDSTADGDSCGLGEHPVPPTV